ncbi:hypothetical protein RD792_002958 [Penstemon davidsonii]|uniref:Glutamate receptor n=1 Tax=Penstemon davidsonii TaxID=160366 RepID=A0ABR0DTF7_9LAMI|nr:hypothetical protein RD792_002958 [Penstemon davidsonii]
MAELNSKTEPRLGKLPVMKIFPIIVYLLLFGFRGRYANEVNDSHQKHAESQHNFREKDIINIGVIVDMGSWLGKVVSSCITMAIMDFYNVNSQYKTRIVLHMRDSRGDSLHSIAAALDLLEIIKVHAMIVPIISNKELFIARLGDKANVPLLSLSSLSSSDEHPFFLQVAGDETTQFRAIAALIESFKWKRCVILYEDTADARQIQPYLYNILQKNHMVVIYQTAISVRATNDQIVDELHKLVNNSSSIFIVHMSPSLTSRVFLNAKRLGMMNKGFAWILTSKTMDFLDSQDSSVYELMQGALGFKSYIYGSSKLQTFKLRWRKEFHLTESNMEIRDLNVYGIWAYDAVWALAQAIERAGLKPSRPGVPGNLLDLGHLRVSDSGVALLNQISSHKFIGLAGEFELLNRKLVHETYEIVNVIGKGQRRVGFWTSASGLNKEIYPSNRFSSNNAFETIIWPGISITTPASQLVQISGKSLRVGIPRVGTPEMVSWHYDQQTNVSISDGFCMEVFRAAFDWLQYNISFDYIPFDNGSYNDLLYQVFLQNYDVAVGDITILSNRSAYVDFSLPFTDMGVGMVAKLDRKDPLFFLKPLDPDLWIASACLFVFTGTVVWLIERPTNPEFQGTPAEQVGTILCYTANLSSLLTVQKFKLTKSDYIGSANPLVRGLTVSNLNFGDDRLKPYQRVNDYDDALRKGSNNGGVGVIIDEIPYIKIFLAKYPHDYTIIETTMNTNGFGFAFQKGSPLVQEVSRAIAGLREEGKLLEMEKKWFTRRPPMLYQETQQPMANTLSFENFSGLFLISGITKSIAILFLLMPFLSRRFYVFRLMQTWRVLVMLRPFALRRVNVPGGLGRRR